MSEFITMMDLHGGGEGREGGERVRSMEACKGTTTTFTSGPECREQQVEHRVMIISS